ncbi:MAG: recombinase family protein [Pseudonocardiaceae bacterium]
MGQPAAIYCRISKSRDEDQTGVDRQERLCREVAERLGLVIVPERVYNRSAWQRRRHRPGWDALLAAIRAGWVRHVIVYHPDRLMRQPRDLEELLTLSEEHDITLHGRANRRDLSDADDRFFLRIEVAHACRSSDDTSRRIRHVLADRARDGRPHPTSRRYGYARDGMTLIEHEAEVVRGVFARYLEGVSQHQIAEELAERRLPTARGKEWSMDAVREMLSSRYVTGIRVFRGEDIGAGDWPAIIDRGTWTEVQDRRAYRAHPRRPNRFYVLRGLVMCKRCVTPMSGSHIRDATYVCSRQDSIGPARCARRINATMLEDFVCDAAVQLLTDLDVSAAPVAATVLSAADQGAISADEAEWPS